jgi:hypothetical protein
MVTQRVGICGKCAFTWESAFVQGELHSRLYFYHFSSCVEPLSLREGLALFLEVLSCFGLLLVVLSHFLSLLED